MAFLVAVAGCSAAPAPTDWRPVVGAFKDCLETYYAVRIKGPEAEKALARRRSEAGGRLLYELERRGARPAKEEAGLGLAGLVPYVERYLHTRTEDVALAEVEPGDRLAPGAPAAESAFPGSFLVVGGASREERALALAGRSARFGLVRYRDVLVAPLDVYRAGKLEDPPRLWVLGRTIYADASRAAPTENAPIALAAAAMLFAGTPDPERRDAQALIALLDGPEAAVAVRALRAIASGPAGGRPPRALALALDAVRAGLDAREATDAAILARLGALTAGDRERIVRAALRPGGLLEPPRAGS